MVIVRLGNKDGAFETIGQFHKSIPAEHWPKIEHPSGAHFEFRLDDRCRLRRPAMRKVLESNFLANVVTMPVNPVRWRN